MDELPLAAPHRLSAPWLVLLSSFAAACALGLALFATRNAASLAGQDVLSITPERAAENFILAYRKHAFERAASFATGALKRAVLAQAKRHPAPSPEPDRTAFVLEESRVLPRDRLRLLGVLARPDQDEDSGLPVSLVVTKHEGRYFVEDLQWPSGPLEREP